MADFLLTKDLLADIAKLPPKKRGLVMKVIGQKEWERCADDIFYWLDTSRHPVMPYVYTHDPHPLHTCNICANGATYHFDKRAVHLELRHGIKPKDFQEISFYFSELSTTRVFAQPDELPYIRPILEFWLKEKFYFIEKSRDMMATWLTVTGYTWDTIFHKGRQNIFQSDDASKTAELVKRAFFLWDNQPKFLKNVHKASWALGASRSGILSVPSLNSEILGFPQGPDQIRQYHPSGVFQDEAAFQAEAAAAFMAIKPSIQNGGRFTAVSTANPSWFNLVCRDMENG